MKTFPVVLFLVMLTACAGPDPVVVVVTATHLPTTASPNPSNTPKPTETPFPTDTPSPTTTLTPSWEPAQIGEIENALRNAGYRRDPIMDDEGMNGFVWIHDNAYERAITWEDGTIELQVLHDKSPDVRAEHMEEKLRALDMVMPPGFMTEVREAHQSYNQSVGRTVSGEPDQLYSYGDEWNTVEAEYNSEYVDIGPYTVKFSLYWWQTTCPPQYWYCYFYGFPGLEFTGDSSFTFYTITLLPYESIGESGFSG